MGCPYAIGWFDAVASAGLASYGSDGADAFFVLFGKLNRMIKGRLKTCLEVFRRP
ncbi:hypothetical protein NEIELOOT_01343 [Neisseria elongata subsp. glycolytica ATCC 29315]|uniref:Uncharacterized protein n=1 Tax=Neisseria elongata subsp. glycolytica ATCC 29315 TaxID=546263 RepID=D4DQK4_NEIEG|nr:hypothetical protein NEIELOOT_01343 [Neisseria elongata subsp. glycolytica ATCC 29315]